MNEKEIMNFQQALLDWYDAHQKPLPWRTDTEPYHVWISEIMSQQTQVETVIPYYERFMAQYPSVAALAAADDAELLKLWEGLGYYSRARNLKLAAGQIMSEFGGKFPSNLTEIRQLRGIGPYTAAAIGAISFGLAEPAIDGNLLRVSSRLFEISDDIVKPASRKVFDALLRDLISGERPGDFNQALMDIGSLVCTPKNPRCEVCPLTDFCSAYEHGTQENFPVKSKKIKQKALYYQAFALQNAAGQWLLEQRPDTGLLAEMWTFPLQEVAARDAAIQLPKNLRADLVKFDRIGEITHIFSHQKWTVTLVKCQLADQNLLRENTPIYNARQRWVNLSNLTDIPLAGPQIKLFKLLEN